MKSVCWLAACVTYKFISSKHNETIEVDKDGPDPEERVLMTSEAVSFALLHRGTSRQGRPVDKYWSQVSPNTSDVKKDIPSRAEMARMIKVCVLKKSICSHLAV